MEHKRSNLTLKEKAEILQQYYKLTKMSQRNAAVQLKVKKLLERREDIKKK